MARDYDDEIFANPQKAIPEPETALFIPADSVDLSEAVELSRTPGDFNLIKLPHGTDNAVRIALISDIKLVRIHTVDKVRYRCLSALDKVRQPVEKNCCELFGGQRSERDTRSQLSAGAVAIRYMGIELRTGNFGKGTPTNVPFEIGWVKLSASMLGNLRDLVPADRTYRDVDFIVKGRGKDAIGYDYSSKQATWYRKDPTMLAAVKEAATPYLDCVLLTKKLAKAITAEEYDALSASAYGEALLPDGEDN
jgi:hypothetical protein